MIFAVLQFAPYEFSTTKLPKLQQSLSTWKFYWYFQEDSGLCFLLSSCWETLGSHTSLKWALHIAF